MSGPLAVVVVMMIAVVWPNTSARSVPTATSGDWGRNWASDHPADPGLVGVVAAVVAVVVSAAVVRSPALVVVAPLVWLAWHRERGRRGSGRIADRRRASMIAFVDDVSSGLRGGRSLAATVVSAAGVHSDRADVGDRHPGLASVAAGVDAGRSLPAAFDAAFTDGRSSPGGSGFGSQRDEALVAVTFLALDASGASAADAFDRVGDALREHRAARADARTQAQQAISSAAVMAALPVVFGIVAAAVEPAVAQLYRSTWTGAGCVGGALACSIIGWEWQQWIIGGHR